jgi:transcriptional regulator with XRE-family HTH domain
MSRGPSPTVRRRRLAARLRELRETANLTIDEVGDRLECSASKISRIETGHVGVTPRDVRDMLEVYGVEENEREALVQLAREARKKGWWHAYNEVFTGAFVGLESDASFLHTHQALLVPGLLQTEAYTRAVIRAIRPDIGEADVELRVRARLNRQKLITEETNPPEYWVVLDEAAVSRQVGGPEVMRDQLKKLVEVASLPHVTLQVVPFSAGGHAGMDTPFLILGFPEQADPDVVYVEYSTSGVYLEQPEDVHRYTLMFDHLRAAALKPDDTLDLVDRTADRLS